MFQHGKVHLTEINIGIHFPMAVPLGILVFDPT